MKLRRLQMFVSVILTMVMVLSLTTIAFADEFDAASGIGETSSEESFDTESTQEETYGDESVTEETENLDSTDESKEEEDENVQKEGGF